MNLVGHDSANLLGDVFVFARFDLDITIPFCLGVENSEVVQPSKDKDGYGTPRLLQPGALRRQILPGDQRPSHSTAP